jgi:hypothetical protein
MEPERTVDLEGQADEAKRGLLLTLDILAERRQNLRVLLSRTRSRLEAGALILSMLFLGAAMIGVLSLTRRRRFARIFSRR